MLMSITSIFQADWVGKKKKTFAGALLCVICWPETPCGKLLIININNHHLSYIMGKWNTKAIHHEKQVRFERFLKIKEINPLIIIFRSYPLSLNRAKIISCPHFLSRLKVDKIIYIICPNRFVLCRANDNRILLNVP